MNEDTTNGMNGNSTSNENQYDSYDGYFPQWFYDYLNGADVPNGFQDLNPNILNMIAVFAGAIVSSNLPFNMQNVIGNWLELAGQYIETYNAQQQYFQGGPGRFYNPIYKNVANPFSQGNGSDETGNEIFGSSSVQSSSNNTSSQITLEQLYQEIKELKHEIEELKGNK